MLAISRGMSTIVTPLCENIRFAFRYPPPSVVGVFCYKLLRDLENYKMLHIGNGQVNAFAVRV
jgi:hypothetical protein